MVGLRDKHLLVVSDEQIVAANGEHFVTNPLVVLFEALRPHFRQVSLSGRTRSASLASGVGRRVSLDVVARPYYESFGAFLRSPGLWRPTYRALRAAVKRSDLILLRLPSPVAPIVLRLASRQDKPVALFIVSDLPELGRAKRGRSGIGVKGLLQLRAASLVDAVQLRLARGRLVFVTGSRLEARYRRAAREVVSVVPSTITGDDLYRRAPEELVIHNPLRLLSVGRITAEKGIDVLLGAVAVLRRQGVEVEVRVAGDGPARERMQQLACELGLSHAVRFLGHVGDKKELHALFDWADVFLLPSLSEGLPKVLLEAMARSLPIIASDVGSVRDLITHGETGLLVPPADPGALADAIKSLAQRADIAQRIAAGAFREASEHRVEVEAAKIAEVLLREVLQRPESPQ